MPSSNVVYFKPVSDVSEKEWINLVCLEPHPHLGDILQFKRIEKLKSGSLSMNSEKIRMQNADYYQLDKKEKELLAIIEKFEPEHLVQKFYKGKKRITANDFFEKHFINETVSAEVLAYIKRNFLKVLTLMKGKEIFVWGKKTLNIWSPILIEKTPAKVEYHLERKDGNLIYFIKVFHKNKELNLQKLNSEILVEEPGFVVLGDAIYHFEEQQDAKRLKPFFTKKEIVIPATSEAMYLDKFIKPIAEKFVLKTKGITHIVQETHPRAMIKLMVFNQVMNVSLHFQYGSKVYNAHEVVKGVVKINKGSDGEWEIVQSGREFNWERTQMESLLELGFKHYQGAIYNIPTSQSLESFIDETIPTLRNWGFQVDQGHLKNPFLLAKPQIFYTMKQENDWFDLDIIVKLGTFDIPFKKFRKNLVEGNRYYELPDKSIAILPEEWFTRLLSMVDLAEDMPSGAVRLRHFHYGLLEELDSLAVNRSEERLHTILSTFKKNVDVTTPERFTATLRSYQQTGLQWLMALHENRFGGLLADDMGLGKTIQTLAFFECLHHQSENKIPEVNKKTKSSSSGTADAKFMVVAPTSLMFNWKEEIEKFTGLTVFIYSGNNRNRFVWEYFRDFDIILTTYGTLRNDMDVLSRVKFDVVVFDEAQNLKNPTSQSSKAARQVVATQKIMLSGTPVENSTSDLWSLINISNPGLLGTHGKFVKTFATKIEKLGDNHRTEELKKLIMPFVLRRTKEQVASELPPRHEQILYCEMSSKQSTVYEKTKSAFRNDLLKTVRQIGIDKSRFHVLKGLLQLRQMANHPFLADNEYDGDSGKFNQIYETLEHVLEGGNKVLLFSQFVKHLKLFRNALDQKGVTYAYIDGATPVDMRSQQVKQFQHEKDCNVFLISLKAGGVGLNLTAADYVFIADPWWNPAVERQAMDRAHRIGRENPVFVYKFISENSVEEKIKRMQDKKKQIAGDLIDEEPSWLSNITTEELDEILS
jgi:superfamily II DNA or RNA helicase